MKNIYLIIVGLVLLASCKKTETFIDPQIVDSVESINEIVTPPRLVYLYGAFMLKGFSIQLAYLYFHENLFAFCSIRSY